MSDFSDDFDVEKLALPSDQIPKLKTSQKPPKAKNKGLFLSHIPWDWLQVAMNLPGSALKVSLVLWLNAGLKKSRTIKFSIKGSEKFGITRNSARSGLRELEQAGLIEAATKAGASTLVTLLDVRAKPIEI